MSKTEASPQTGWAKQASVPAVVAGYPLLEVLRTCRMQALSPEEGYGRAPFNVMAHSARQWTDADRDFVTPANDLLYSNAWVDLRAGPVVLEIPAATRYFVVECLDVYTNNFLNLGTRNVPPEGGRFALLAPGTDETQAPAGTRPVHCPTPLVWLLGRVLVDGPHDLEAARAMQAGFDLKGPSIAWPMASLAGWQEGGDPALDFFSNLARALADFPPPADQRAPFELMASAHIRLPASGSLTRLRPSSLEGLRQAHAEGMALIEGHTRSASKLAWRYSTRLGRFGDDYMLRAATAMKGIAALSADEAVYALADYDHQGEPLHGGRVWRVRRRRRPAGKHVLVDHAIYGEGIASWPAIRSGGTRWGIAARCNARPTARSCSRCRIARHRARHRTGCRRPMRRST
ncbi:MAG: DUF1254 domain-containing protein [Burkholderiaceae bacterium]